MFHFLMGILRHFHGFFFSFIKKERCTIIIFVISKEKFLEVDTFYYVEKSHIKEASPYQHTRSRFAAAVSASTKYLESNFTANR